MSTQTVSDRALRATPWSTWGLLALGVIAASVSAVLIRYADDAHPLAISFWRCALGAAALAPFASRRLVGTERRKLMACGVAGAFLAIHFATWITSVGLTTIALSVLLVSTTPVFVAAAAYFFGERLSARGWLGIMIALAGTALIAGLEVRGSSLIGNLLALAGAATAGGYVMAGKWARRALGVLEYATLTYAIAAAALLVACMAGGVALTGYDSQTWLAIAAIVAGPQLLGHTLINLVLKDIDATTVSVSIMAEPVIATALAYVMFAELPGALVYPGGAAILAGIYLVSSVRRPQAVVVE